MNQPNSDASSHSGLLPQQIAQIETPAPLVEVSRVKRNLDRMADYARSHKLQLRPHVKTHKTTVIGAAQMRRGAAGLTCATPREMEIMSSVSPDLLLAHPPLGLKIDRLLMLPRSVSIVTALDSVAAIDWVADAASGANRTVRVYVEMDVGMHRVGVTTPKQVVELAEHVAAESSLEYAGICFYPGHIRETVNDQDAKIFALNDLLGETVSALERAGLKPPTVSGGSTPTAWRTHEMPLVTEFRPGTYVFNDRTTAAVGACEWDDCAFTVLATVVSTAVPGQAVVDAGSKALGREPMRGANGEGFGALMGHEDVIVSAMSEEHGMLDLSRTDWRPRVGDTVRIVPNHVCIVVHLNDALYAVDGDRVTGVWPVAARGRMAPFTDDEASTTAPSSENLL
ncbi:MAG TPA: alanine racemase [Gemmatimonadaceae bacterium]|nr:alanine racemase [Gemmatimonadaceae bacterium]